MTKVSVFGQEATESKPLKPIEFVKMLGYGGKIEPSACNPEGWSNIMLLEKKYTSDDFDLIMAWNNINNKTIYLGHWNDGVI